MVEGRRKYRRKGEGKELQILHIKKKQRRTEEDIEDEKKTTNKEGRT